VVPDDDEEPSQQDTSAEVSQHGEVQAILIDLGATMGYRVFLARNDRGRLINGQTSWRQSRGHRTSPTRLRRRRRLMPGTLGRHGRGADGGSVASLVNSVQNNRPDLIAKVTNAEREG
jgi:hypothetical protein